MRPATQRLAGNVPVGSMGTATAVFATGVLDIHEVDVDGNNVFNPVESTTFRCRSR